jgi:proton-coupled amino acid transporter
MSSPSQPLNIRGRKAPNPTDADGLSASFATSVISGTPDLRALRAGYVGTPPLPNIPLRLSATPASSRRDSTSLHPPEGSSPRRPVVTSPGPVVGGISASASARSTTPLPTPEIAAQVEDLRPEEKAKVVGRHLVPQDQRAKPGGQEEESSSASTPSGESENDQTLSRRSSDGIGRPKPRRDESVSFPIPYHAPGADVT